MLSWLMIIGFIIIIALFLYWQLIITEGTYLGARAVVWMYDATAKRYNSIKEFMPEFEDQALGHPLANRLHHQPQATVLDVATGTGRIPLTLLRQANYQGQIIGLDRAAKMLDIARQDTAAFADRVTFIQADASALPFADNSFPVVSCVELLEFLPNPEAGLQELVRVLAPATSDQPDQGWLVTSNRIGWEAWLMPGKTWSRQKLAQILKQMPLRYIEIRPWQTIYDIVWVQKTARHIPKSQN